MRRTPRSVLRRVVEIAPNLYAWLGTIQNREGALVDEGTYRENLENLRTASGIAEWPHNAQRHSFASYHLAAYGDAMKTATILGHKDPGVVHYHYKALVVEATALKFWELRPLATEVATPPNVQGTPK